jgi:hypothetical protein
VTLWYNNKENPMADTMVSVAAQGLDTYTFGQQRGHVTIGFAVLGASNTAGLRFTLTGLSLTTPTPRVVAFHPRQSDNNERNFSDEFVVQVIQTTTNNILGRVLRVDSNSGWGQQLRLDFLIID